MTRRLPPLNALRAFEAAARHLSFTKAAEELFVTQAAVSHQIKGLEDYLGISLFHRLNRALSLTEAGKAYLPSISAAFDGLDRATAALQSERNATGVLTASVTPVFLSRWLIPRLADWQEKHPEIDLRVSSNTRLVDFAREDVDFAVRFGKGDWPDLHVDLLFRVVTVPVCSPRLLPLRGPEDLAHHTLLHDMVEPNAWRDWLKTEGIEGIDPSRGPRFGTGADALQAAIDGAGVALGRRPLIDRDIEAGALVAPFATPAPKAHGFFFVCPKAYLERPKLRAFREWALAHVAAKSQPRAATR
jgi:LysR family glycine cleavage system transcriptional activator